MDEPDSPWLHYLLLRAVNKFHAENGAYPGFYDDNVETDIGKLKVIVTRGTRRLRRLRIDHDTIISFNDRDASRAF